MIHNYNYLCTKRKVYPKDEPVYCLECGSTMYPVDQDDYYDELNKCEYCGATRLITRETEDSEC